MRATERTGVLLIDDDELSRAVLELHFSAAGYAVRVAESGEAALRLLGDAAGDAFDVVLSDLQMPGLHGPALAQALREAAGERMPLLAMSGSEPSPERYAGFDGFLLKPFTPEEFAEVLRHVQRGGGVIGEERTNKMAAVVLDEATFAQLEVMMKPVQMEELFSLSFSELEMHIERMQQAIETGDAAAMRASAHAMKGGFSMLGAWEMRDLGAMLETGMATPPDQAATRLSGSGVCLHRAGCHLGRPALLARRHNESSHKEAGRIRLKHEPDSNCCCG